MLEQFEELIDREYQAQLNANTDINEHIYDLYQLACDCKHVTEFGSRYGSSTRAFLKAPVTLRAYDLELHKPLMDLFQMAQSVGKDVKYEQGNTLEIAVESTDMLFIDTWHTQQQLRAELERHGNIARKYMVFHDTHTYGVRDELLDWSSNPDRSAVPHQGLLPAVIDFVIANPQWRFKKHKTNNNGLTILERVS